MKDPNSNPNEELARRFRADLRRPISERYYSEEELVSVFDYGGDQGDDYLRTEALLLGARLYPDSSELLQRRAIYYRSFTDRSFDDFLDDNPDVNEPLWEILKMGKFTGTAEEAEARLAEYLEENRLVTDEEVIQFVQLAADLGLNDWLFSHIDLLRRKVDYLPTLLYELAASAEMDRRYDLETEMLEQLTEIDPYCADYWRLLAKIQAQQGLADEALNSIDLALAIDPDSADSLAVRLSLLKAGTEEFTGTARRIFALRPEDPDTIDTVISAVTGADDGTLIHDMYESLLTYIDDMPDLVEQAISANAPGMYPVICTALERLYDAGQTDRELWLSLASTAYEAKDDLTVAQIHRTFEAKSGKPLNHDYLALKAMFRHRQYELVVDTFAASENDGTIRRPENMLVAYAMFVMALLRTGRLAQAGAAAKGLLEIFNERNELVNPIEAFGMNTFLADVCRRTDKTQPAAGTDWDAYDPLGLDRL